MSFQKNTSVAVLMTCYNRKQVTLDCLSALFSINSDIDVYCTDDASSDGTKEEIKRLFPKVIVLNGDGNLFWSRGMRKSWEAAVHEKDYDYYIWLNDDLHLLDDSLNELFECSRLVSDKAIITGLVQGKTTKQTVYGGYDKNRKLIEPNRLMNPVSFLNGNIVLIPKYVYHKIGMIDSVYHHDLGDVAYGLEAHKHEISVFTTRKHVGTTDEKLICNILRYRKQQSNIAERFRHLYSPLGCNPCITFYFHKKYKGIYYALPYYIYLHIINIIPDFIWNCIKQIRKSK